MRSAKWQISTDGGYAPVWSRDKQELFYRSADRTMVVDVRTRPEFGSPRVLFEARYPNGVDAGPVNARTAHAMQASQNPDT